MNEVVGSSSNSSSSTTAEAGDENWMRIRHREEDKNLDTRDSVG